VLALNGVEGLEITPQKGSQKLFAAENNTEALILNVLQQEPMYIDTIIKKTELPPAQIATNLALMEISGKIRNLGGNVYSIA